jgi:hypothetical protein
MQSPLLFRVGELVWYQNGATWRLGLIASSNAPTSHQIVPIGHAHVLQPNVAKTDNDMRPFYAFSVPPVTIPELKNKMYDDISWDAVLQTAAETGKRDVFALDASKMAASKIDLSHSLWSPLSEDQGKTSSYFGCFLGAERIEVGDCVRLRTLPPDVPVSPESVVFAIQFILTSTDYPGVVFFRGHIYAPAGKGANPPNAVPAEHLPIALRDESEWRSRANPAQPWRWRLAKETVTLKEQSIRGRVYPTHRLMPILKPAEFQNAVAQGQISDLYAHLNNRMDGATRYIGRKKNRMDTLGPAVPPTAFQFEPYIREEA